MKMILGSELCLPAQREALARFVHRFTGDHCPDWARRQPRRFACPVQFASDADWLAHTRFAVRSDGLLSERHRYCESSPTWPNNPELRRP